MNLNIIFFMISIILLMFTYSYNYDYPLESGLGNYSLPRKYHVGPKNILLSLKMICLAEMLLFRYVGGWAKQIF